MRDTPLIVYVTCPNHDTAQHIASQLVEQRCAACVNIVPGLVSIYRWQERIETSDELLLMIKTTESAFTRLQATVLALHPDELPEIVAVPIAQGLPGYLDWVKRETKSQ